MPKQHIRIFRRIAAAMFPLTGLSLLGVVSAAQTIRTIPHRLAVTFSGGDETDPSDRGRPLF